MAELDKKNTTNYTWPTHKPNKKESIPNSNFVRSTCGGRTHTRRAWSVRSVCCRDVTGRGSTPPSSCRLSRPGSPGLMPASSWGGMARSRSFVGRLGKYIHRLFCVCGGCIISTTGNGMPTCPEYADWRRLTEFFHIKYLNKKLTVFWIIRFRFTWQWILKSFYMLRPTKLIQSATDAHLTSVHLYITSLIIKIKWATVNNPKKLVTTTTSEPWAPLWQRLSEVCDGSII